MTRKVVEHRIAVTLAGRAAERVLLGEVSAGADSDICLARRLAITAVTEWGLSSSSRITSVGKRSHPAHRREAGQMLDAADALGLDLMRERKPQVRAIADALIKRRALAHADIVALLDANAPVAGKAASRKPIRKRA